MGDRLNARAAAAPRIVFDYRGAAGRSGAGALFGLWNFRPAPRVASFALEDRASVAEEANAEAPVWRVELPPNYQSALAYLRAAEESLSVQSGGVNLGGRRAGAAVDVEVRPGSDGRGRRLAAAGESNIKGWREKMASDTDNLVKNTLAKVADYVRDVATMTVQTEYTRVGAAEGVNFDQAKPAALTVLKLDGDCRAVIPMREGRRGSWR